MKFNILLLSVLFCSVNNYGGIGGCYLTYSMCQEAVESSRGYFVACIAKQQDGL